MKITRYNKIILCLLCSIIIGTIIGVGFVVLVITKQTPSNGESNMITLLSIIVTMGIAYSFFSIYRVSNEFYEFKRVTERLKHQLKKGLSDLDGSIKEYKETHKNDALQLKLKSDSVDKRLELYRRDLGASSSFNKRRYLLALKIEIETLAFVLQNDKYLSNELLENKNELESAIGSKRSLIANDLRKCIKYLTNEKVQKFPDNEYEDSKRSINNAIEIIKLNRNFSLINYAESERYIYLFNLIKDLFRAIDEKRLPYKIEDKERLKLMFYYKGIIVGTQTDDQLCIKDWIRKYEDKERRDKEEQDGLQNDSTQYIS